MFCLKVQEQVPALESGQSQEIWPLSGGNKANQTTWGEFM